MNEVTIAFWDGNTLIGELSMEWNAGTTWVPSPSKPDNNPNPPDIEMDPFRKLIKLKGHDVVDIPTEYVPEPVDPLDE